MFGDIDYEPECAYSAVPLEEQLEALAAAVRQGKVRHVGLSNETPWGVMRCITAGKAGFYLCSWEQRQHPRSCTTHTVCTRSHAS